MKPFSKSIGMAAMILLAGCSVTVPIKRDASAIGALTPDSRIKVYPDSGKHYKMRFEEIRNDTVFGYTSERNVRQPLARIDSLFWVRDDPSRSTALVLASIPFALVAVLWIWYDANKTHP